MMLLTMCQSGPECFALYSSPGLLVFLAIAAVKAVRNA